MLWCTPCLFGFDRTPNPPNFQTLASHFVFRVIGESSWWDDVCCFEIFEPMEQKLLNFEWFLSLESKLKLV
jgi:hypothetical protein